MRLPAITATIFSYSLLNKGLPTFVINPLHTNLYWKSLSLRKTKNAQIDARTIATMLMSGHNAAISHAAKKLVQLIYAMEKFQQFYTLAT